MWFALTVSTCVGALWRARHPGEEQRHLQRWHLVYSQGQQVGISHSAQCAHTCMIQFIYSTCVCTITCPALCVCARACRLDFIYDLFERVGSRNGDETLKMGTARRKPTVSSQFRVRETEASVAWISLSQLRCPLLCHHTDNGLIVSHVLLNTTVA